MADTRNKLAATSAKSTAAPAASVAQNVGSQIKHDYKNRTTPTVAVDQHELNELLTLDLLMVGFMNIGSFFFSGGAWLGIERFSDLPKDAPLTPLIIGCIFSMILGVVFLGAAIVHFRMRRTKIRNIFKETQGDDGAEEIR